MRHILVMGPPGSGKTLFSKLLATKLDAVYFSVDHLVIASKTEVIKCFCEENSNLDGPVVIDYTCPLPVERKKLQEMQLFIIWMDTKPYYALKKGQTFIPPGEYDICITNFEFDDWSDKIIGTLGETRTHI